MTSKKLSKRDLRKVFLPLAQKEKLHNKSRPSNLTMKQFDNHPYFKNIIKHAIIPIWEENRKSKKEGKEFFLNDELKYHGFVFEYSGAFYEGLKRLNDIPLFTLKGFSPRWLNNMKIAQQEWAIYNYANYRVVATGIYDTALLITNDVLELGKKPEKVYRNFIDNPEIAENQLLEPLQKIEELIAKYRDERNLYVHRSTRPEIDFVNNLYAYQTLKEAKEKGLYKKEIPSPKIAQKYYEAELNKKVDEMQEETEGIFSAVIAFLDVLNPLYEKKIEFYKGKIL
ncbi:MAG: hypothetical protein JNK81_11250 [Anaerolineales bacterium]|nr:hypothetical protein [Anaerolineales bacterium]